MGSTVLKLEGTGGDLKEMSTTDENYLAYQAGLQLAAMGPTSAAALTTSASGATVIGSFSDTVYDQNVGDHGALTVTTTTTNLYQVDAVADTSGGDYRLPVEFIDNSGDYEIHELTQTEVNTLTDRLVSRIMTSEYPGTYRLGSSAPSGDYDTHLASVFSDTKTDGSSVAYNIYQRQTMSAPTAVRPVSVKRSSGRTGTYQGLQEMTDAQIKYTFGQEAKTRIMNGSDGVGTYQLRTSSQGAPVASGTWSARGTATDTRNAVADTDYSANYEGNYQSEFTADYTGEFTTTYGAVFTGNFLGNYTGNFAREFTADFSRTFTGNFTGNFDRIFTGTFTGNFVRDFTGNFLRDFTAAFAREFEGNFLRDFVGNFSREFVREFEGNFAREFTGNFTRDFTGAFDRNFTADYTGDFERDFTGDFQGDFTGTIPQNYTRDAQQVFLGNYTTDFNTSSTVGYATDFNISSNVGYARDFNTSSNVSYARDFNISSNVSYATDFNISSNVSYATDFSISSNVTSTTDSNVSSNVNSTRNSTNNSNVNSTRESQDNSNVFQIDVSSRAALTGWAVERVPNSGPAQLPYDYQHTLYWLGEKVHTFRNSGVLAYQGTVIDTTNGEAPSLFPNGILAPDGVVYYCSESPSVIGGYIGRAYVKIYSIKRGENTLTFSGAVKEEHGDLNPNNPVLFTRAAGPPRVHYTTNFTSGALEGTPNQGYYLGTNRVVPSGWPGGVNYQRLDGTFVGNFQGLEGAVVYSRLYIFYGLGREDQSYGSLPPAGSAQEFSNPSYDYINVNPASQTDYAGTTVVTYTGNFTGDFTGTSPAGNYVYGPIANAPAAPRPASRTGTFVGGGSPVTYTRTSTRAPTATGPATNYTGAAQAVYTGFGFTADVAPSFIQGAAYQGTFVGNYTGNFAGAYTGDFTGNFQREFVRTFTGNFDRNFVRTFTGNFDRNFVRTFTGNFDRNFVRTYTGNFDRNFVRTFSGNFDRNFVRTYTGNFERDFVRTFTGNFDRSFTGTYTGDFAGTTPAEFSGATSTQTSTDNYTAVSTRTFDSEFTTDFTQDFTTDSTVTSAANSTINSVVESTSTYTSDFTTVSVSEFERAYTSDFTTVFTTASTADSTTDSTGSSTRDSQRNTDQIFTREFQSIYTRDSQRTTTVDSGTSRDSNFSRISTRDFVAEFVGDYVGNYVGSEIQASGTTIETYTLYVRTA